MRFTRLRFRNRWIHISSCPTPTTIFPLVHSQLPSGPNSTPSPLTARPSPANSSTAKTSPLSFYPMTPSSTTFSTMETTQMALWQMQLSLHLFPPCNSGTIMPYPSAPRVCKSSSTVTSLLPRVYPSQASTPQASFALLETLTSRTRQSVGPCVTSCSLQIVWARAQSRRRSTTLHYRPTQVF